MTNLLPELIPLIIPDLATSRALALVNRHYNDTVTPILYKQVTLEGLDAIEAFSDTMVSGRPILRQYPMLLHIFCWPGNSMRGRVDPDDLIPPVKQILMHVPNLIDLALALDEPIKYLIEKLRYPFKLHSLQMWPIWDTGFVEFLRTQPEIEAVTFWDHSNDDHSPLPGAPLQLDILPKLRSITAGKTNISMMVPLHPITTVNLSGILRNFDVHEKIAQSLVPLESLTESMKGRVAPSHGLEIIRTSLSTFSTLRTFSLDFHDLHRADVTSEFCETVPELSRFDVWQESCPTLEEVRLFGIISLKKV